MGKCIAFKLTFFAEAQAVVLPIDMTLVLVHPTQPSLNKNRPLKSSELFVSSDYVVGFCFAADTLCEQGFVADDMLLLCLEVIE
uniref:Putative secreted protein n=1 Tax=Ixodes ricinus TaxID=34613 RepID=A0A6B0U8B1_IXORI